MKHFAKIIIVILIVSFACLPARAADKDPADDTAAGRTDFPGPDYIIGPGDVLFISLWKDDALTHNVTVLPDGTISFPLIGKINARGKTVDWLKAVLEKQLQKYSPDPVLTVMVQQVNSMFIYIIGKVNGPGRYPINTNINVMQALATAGGLNTFAKSGSIKIFRQTAKGTKIYKFDYDDVADGENLAQNITLVRGDLIVVP